MPFINLDKEDNIEKYKDADVIIIGAGAAGILLAVDLSKKHRKVVLIECGDFNISEEKQLLNEVVNTNKILGSAVYGRYRAIGGTTLAWGGGSLPFSKIDFEKRSWVTNSGWPIPYTEIEKYYVPANNFMGIDALNYTTEILPKLKTQDPGFDQSVFDFHVCKWAPQPNFQTLYRDHLLENVTVLYNANFTRFVLKENSREINAVLLSNFNLQQFTLTARYIILATGGIETSRVLLSNRPAFPPSVGRDNWLGKTFMEHPCICIGYILPRNNWNLQKVFNTHLYQNRKYSIRLSLNEKFQELKKILNCSASIMFYSEMENGFDPYRELKDFKQIPTFKKAFRLFRSLPSFVKSSYAYFLLKYIYKENAVAKLQLMIEQEPVTESYIGLTDELDIFGQPKAKINWSISHKTWETAIVTTQKFKEELERLNFGKVEIEKEVDLTNAHWESLLTDVNHHMGGVRMSLTEEEGVVDTDLNVWGIDNLFVCSSAVFPTSSHSNPTLTLLALGLRLSEHLNNKLN